MKLNRIAFFIISCIFLASVISGCANLAAGLISSAGLGLADAIVSPATTEPKRKNGIYDLIEKHEIGKNTVAIHMATIKGKPGYLFLAIDRNGQVLGNLFCHATNENDMIEYNKFLKMNSVGKKQFIQKTFLRLAKVDLGPVESDAPILLASYTPAVGDTFAKVVENLGRPDDEFLLKDERGEPVPNTNMVWYFTVKDDQLTRALSMYVRDGIVSKVEERTNDKPPYTIGFYKSYLYLCATMAYRAPKFAFALNEPSPIN